MAIFSRGVRQHTRVYFTGGASAVLMGWRESTIDLDIRFEPEHDELFRALPRIKEELQVNVELAAPSDFIPQLPGWQERSQLIDTEGKVSYYHYDFYSQALSKIERGHDHDIKDVEAMIKNRLVEPKRLLELFKEIEPQLYKYPAIDPASFLSAVKRFAFDRSS